MFSVGDTHTHTHTHTRTHTHTHTHTPAHTHTHTQHTHTHTQSDSIVDLEKTHGYRDDHFDFIQQSIRKFCLNCILDYLSFPPHPYTRPYILPTHLKQQYLFSCTFLHTLPHATHHHTVTPHSPHTVTPSHSEKGVG